MTYDEAASVANIGTVFDGSNIVHFEELQDFGVTALPTDSFKNTRYLRRITLPKGLKHLGGAFYWPYGSVIEELSIPASMETYSPVCINRNSSLKRIFLYPNPSNIRTSPGLFCDNVSGWPKNGKVFIPVGTMDGWMPHLRSFTGTTWEIVETL